VLDHPLPWTKMRQVYALLGLVKKWGPARVNEACQKAAEAEAFSVPLIGRMLVRATEGTIEALPVQGQLLTGRFVRPAEDFAVVPAKWPDPDTGGHTCIASEATTADASDGASS
jgi:hypothetical protein